MTGLSRHPIAVRLCLLLLAAAVVLAPGWARTGVSTAGGDENGPGSGLLAPALDTVAVRDIPASTVRKDPGRTLDRRPSSTPLAVALVTGVLLALLVVAGAGANDRLAGRRGRCARALGSRAPPLLPSV